jgi:putative signal transducing protein
MTHATDRSRQKLKQVFSTHNEIEARLVQELLRNAGIESVINAQIDSSLFPLNVGGLAKQDVLVLESDAGEAGRIIAEQEELGGQTAE